MHGSGYEDFLGSYNEIFSLLQKGHTQKNIYMHLKSKGKFRTGEKNFYRVLRYVKKERKRTQPLKYGSKTFGKSLWK